MAISRREFGRLAAGAGALAAASQLGRTASVAQTAPTFRAMVGLFLYGGNDGWNMVVPTGARYAGYAAGRGASLALPESSLVPLAGAAFGLNPAMGALKSVWDAGALALVLNTGSLIQPLTKALYQQRADLRPGSLFSHSAEQLHWETAVMQGSAQTGVLGRTADKLPDLSGTPPLISIAGSHVALLGKSSSPLVLPSTGVLTRNGFNAAATDAATVARQNALAAFAQAAQDGLVAQRTAAGLSDAFAQATVANQLIGTAPTTVDQYFKNQTTGAPLTSDISRQLLRIARLIEGRATLGHSRQVFMAQQGGFDTHANQVDVNPTTGTQADLLADLANAVRGFHDAMAALGLSRQVTLFTMSDFGRVYRGNTARGSDHAWGNNHLVVGGALTPQMAYGRYPDTTLGGPDDVDTNGRWLPGIAIEEYVGAVAQWFGVAAADLPYVFPNWATWNGGGRGPVPLFA